MQRTLSIISFALLGTAAAAQQKPAQPGDMVQNAHLTPAATPGALYTREPRKSDLEASCFYAFSAGKDDYYSPDMIGVEFTYAYHVTPRNAFTLSLCVAGANEGEEVWYSVHYRHYTDEFERIDLALMGGYRFTQPLGHSAHITLGVKCGLDVQSLGLNYDEHYEWDWDADAYVDRTDDHGVAAGFAYAGYAELGFRITEDASLTVCYQFRGATSRPSAKFPDGYTVKTKSMLWHEVHVGVEIHF